MLFSGIKSRGCLLFALFISLAGICRAQTNIHEFTIYLPDSSLDYYIEPEGITFGPDGGYWFCMYAANKIGHFNPLAESNRFDFTRITNGFTNTAPFSIIVGPDTNLWFSASAVNQLVRMDPFSSNYVRFTLPYKNSVPWIVANGPDGNIWFSEFNRNRIACISPTPAVNAEGMVPLLHESPPVSTNSEIYGLTAGPDGNMWFMDGTFGTIYRYNLSGANAGKLTAFPLPQTNCEPVSIVSGPDGALWFTEHKSNTIGRITIEGTITEFPIPRPDLLIPRPTAIIVGPDTNLWFTMNYGSAIGRMTTNGQFTLYPTPTPLSFPTYLATGTSNGTNGPTDTNIFFCENVGGGPGVTFQNIGRLLVGESLNLDAPTNLNFSSGSTVSGVLATFQNSGHTNRATIFWGDGTSNTVRLDTLAPGAFVASGPLTITNTIGVDTNTGANGTYEIIASHTYPSASHFLMTLVVNDPRADFAIANIPVSAAAPAPFVDPFFEGHVSVGNGVDYLQFTNGNIFGYYSPQYYPYVYHMDMGWEDFVDANDGQAGVYMYDFASTHWWYTSPSLFPYLFDFTLNAWLYYYPDPNNPGHYVTNPRTFYDFSAFMNINL